MPKTFVRYIDHCFRIIKGGALTAFTTHLNSMDEAVKFTVEKEHAREKTTFSVFRRSTHTGRYLHFTSINPAFHKRCVVASLVSRMYGVCKKLEDIVADIQHVHWDLSASGYPGSFVHSLESQLACPAPSCNTHPMNRAAIPNLAGISEQLARVLHLYSVQVAHVPT